ncbi:LacI family DNA-binding transcriptional regulator [Roseobacter sp. HKCCD8434]|uniref:LacI family DNA-binding transcriptional regulator n=1 Tax=unclassified Roseobacter TaxID=196798 RepID=UPI00345F6E26
MARSLGLSDMTVSRVLSGRGTVSARTRDLVLAAVEEMGYVKNRMAGSLSSARSNQIGVILPSMQIGIFPEVLAGITKELEKAGYNPVVGVTDYDVNREESLVESLLSWNAAGLIVNDFVHTTRTKKLLSRAEVPVIEIMEVSGEPIDRCVGFDHGAAARALTDHLLSKGYQRIGFLGWHGTEFAASARFSAVRGHLAARGYPIVAPNLYDAPPGVAEGRAGLIRLLEKDDKIDAVIFGNDLMAVGAVFLCQEMGWQVPGRVGVAGFGGLDIGQSLPRRLTTVRFPRYRVGQRAARAVLNALAGQEVPRVTDLQFTLIPGETS